MDEWKLPLKEFDFYFSRSSGAGGQNVNKVNSKVTLRWQISKSTFYPKEVLQRFLERYPRFIVKGEEVVITSQRFRTQARNIADCYEKLQGMLAQVMLAKVTRKPTKATAGSVERRLRGKRQQSAIKRMRQRPQ